MAYEWDAAKNAHNFDKHGIDFADAVLIFDGPVVETIDTRRDYGEQRIAAIGVVNNLELFVVYTHRRGNKRVISARRASKREKKYYREALARRPEEGQD